MNVASRMESTAFPEYTQVTSEIYVLLQNEYQFSSRGLVELKGKGKVQTYYVKGNAKGGGYVIEGAICAPSNVGLLCRT